MPGHWNHLMKQIERQRSQLRQLIESPNDLSREEVVRISQSLDLLILEAQQALLEVEDDQRHEERSISPKKPAASYAR